MSFPGWRGNGPARKAISGWALVRLQETTGRDPGDSKIHRGTLGDSSNGTCVMLPCRALRKWQDLEKKWLCIWPDGWGLGSPPESPTPQNHTQTAWKYVDSTEVEGFTKLLGLLPENRVGHEVSRQLFTWPDDIPPPVPQYRESSPFLRYKTGGSRWRSKSHTGWP